MNTFRLSLILLLVTECSSIALADHPNEGPIAISQLINEAEKNSLVIKQNEETLKSLKLELNSRYGKYSPKLSIEGGPQAAQLDGEKTSGMALYGKLEWNLYNGGSDQTLIEFSNSEIEIQEKSLRTLKKKIKSEVSKIYFELQFILESISLKEKSIKLNSQQSKMAKAKNRSGLTTSSDVLEFDLRESTLQSDLVFLNQQLEQKSRELDVLLAQNNQSVTESVKGHLVREKFLFNRDDLLGKIQENNDQILLSKLELLQIETEAHTTQSLLLPKLDFEARFGKLSNEEQVFNENNNYSFRLKFNIPLFSGFENTNSLKSIIAKKSALQISLEQKKISIKAELDSIISEIKALNSRLDLEEKNLERSEKYYQLTLDEYRRGIKNSPDMVGASERLLEARIRNLEYRRNLMFAKTKIQELTGE